MQRLTKPRPTKLLIATLFVAIAGVVALAVADLARRRDALQLLQRHDPRAEVRFDNPLLGGSWEERIRSRIDGAPLPFDRVTQLTLVGGIAYAGPDPMLDDAIAPALAAALSRLGSVEELRLEETEFGDRGAAIILRATAPRRLFVRNLFVPLRTTDLFGRVLARNDNLRELELVNAATGDRFGIELANSRSLERLTLHNSTLPDAGLLAFARLPTLTHVLIGNRGNSGVTREGAWAFRLARPEIFFDGPVIPPDVPQTELDAYRRERDRLRWERNLME